MIKQDNGIVVIDKESAFKILDCCCSDGCSDCPLLEHIPCLDVACAILNHLKEHCSCDYLKLKME